MSFIADTHVHIYPSYDAAALLAGAHRRLATLAPGLPCVLCLTERADCRIFRDWSAWPERAPTGFTIRSAGEAALRLEGPAGCEIFVIAGRQMATSERLEVHALGCDEAIPDGLSAETCIERVRRAGGLPVLPWGVGKWLGGRGKMVRGLAARHPDLWLGDSSLRPAWWPEPCFGAANHRVLAGSDPLPAPGEEAQAGRLATRFEAPFDPALPVASLRAALVGGGATLLGTHSGLFEVRQRTNAMKRAMR